MSRKLKHRSGSFLAIAAVVLAVAQLGMSS
jgi:hypothetical protein